METARQQPPDRRCLSWSRCWALWISWGGWDTQSSHKIQCWLLVFWKYRPVSHSHWSPKGQKFHSFFFCFAANSDRDGRAAVCDGLCAEESDRWRTGRLEEETADRLHWRTTEHLPGPLGDMVHSPFTTKPALNHTFLWISSFICFFIAVFQDHLFGWVTVADKTADQETGGASTEGLLQRRSDYSTPPSSGGEDRRPVPQPYEEVWNQSLVWKLFNAMKRDHWCLLVSLQCICCWEAALYAYAPWPTTCHQNRSSVHHQSQVGARRSES